MEHKISSRDIPQNSPRAGHAVSSADLSQNKSDSTPFADKVAKRAYFTYVNQGSQPGHAEQHWLEAEAELHAEIVHGMKHRPGL